MLLKGSCHCKAVQFEVDAPHPYPFNKCYCSICRKTSGAGGYGINIGATAKTLKVQGEEHVSVYHAKIDDKENELGRHFCKHCSSALWIYDTRWPELLHPSASAIDTPLPQAPSHVHLMFAYKADWVQAHIDKEDKVFDEYPDESLEQWHKRQGLEK